MLKCWGLGGIPLTLAAPRPWEELLAFKATFPGKEGKTVMCVGKDIEKENTQRHRRTHARTHTHTDTRTNTHTRTHTDTHTQTHTRTHTDMHVHGHTHGHTHTQTHTHTHIHTRAHTYTHAHTHTHTHAHTALHFIKEPKIQRFINEPKSLRITPLISLRGTFTATAQHRPEAGGTQISQPNMPKILKIPLYDVRLSRSAVFWTAVPSVSGQFHGQLFAVP